MRVRKLLALTLAMVLVLGSFTFAFGSTDGFAHAWQESNSQWLFSNVKGWEEGDWIPVRIDPEIGDNEVTVELFYTDGSNIGFDSAKDWFVGYTTESSINAVDVIDNSPTVTGPTKEGDNLRYTIDIPESYSNVSVYGYIHASVTGSKSLYDDSDILTGSSDWSGSSLHMRYVGPNQSRDVSFNIMEGDTVPDPTGSITINKNIEVEDEAVHEGVQFNLTHTSNGDGVLTGYTDSNGELMFNDLPVGNYLLEEIVPLNFETTYTSEVAVTSEQTTEVKVLNNMVENPAVQYVYNGSSIYGYKYNAIEEGLEGWTIELYEEGNTSTPVATTVTDNDGFYEFNGVDEGVYVIKEVMQTGWYNISPIQQTITIGGILGTSSVTHLSDKYDVWEALPDENIEFVAEGRIGDLGKAGEHELNIHVPSNTGTEDEYREFVWNGNGVPEPFKITFDGSEVEYEVGGNILTYTPTSVDTINDLMIRTFADEPNSGIMVNNLKLNGNPIPYTSVAIGNGDQDDVLWMHNFDLTDGFTLEGESVMYWSGDSVPMRSHLAYQIKLGHALHQDEYWADPFINGQEGEEYYSITVNKDVIGTATDTVFTVAEYPYLPNGDSGNIQPSIAYVPDKIPRNEPPTGATTGTISVGNPFTFSGLVPGYYVVGEDPNVEGFITPLFDQVVHITDQDEDLTFTNYQEPSISIEKTVDDSSVKVGEEVTYTITVTNLGGFYLPKVVVEDLKLDNFPQEFSLDIGETKTFTETTTYNEEGTIVNTAVATADVAVVDGEGGIDSMPPDILEDFDVDIIGTFNLKVEDSATVVVSDEQEMQYRIIVDKTVTGNRSDEDDEFEFEIRDIKEGLVDTVTATGDTDGISVLLNPGVYTVTELDPSPYKLTTDNDVQVELGEGNETVEFTNDYNRNITRNTYRMKIDKVADGNFYEVGDTIEYTITVRNTGNSTLREIQVTDDMTGFSEEIDFLNPGASREFITTYEALEVGDLTNTVTAEDDRAGTEEADETVTVEGTPEGVPEYTMTIEKTAVVDGEPIYSGDMVEFTIVVTNTGNETLTNIIVEDDMVDFEAVINNLNPGKSKEFKVKVEAPNVPGPFTNTARATSTETGTLEDEVMVWVTEEPTPQAVPDTGVAPTDLFFGLGALVSGLGVFFTKKRK